MSQGVVTTWWKSYFAAAWFGCNNNNFNLNANNNLNNTNAGRGIAQPRGDIFLRMNMYKELCSYENLLLAFKKARNGKTTQKYVLEFEKNLEENLQQLRAELLFHIYRPKQLTTFILRDPKIRKINKSHFRDRVVHHAIYNIIGPHFEKSFIYDSYANRKGKGTLKAIARFDQFQKIVSRNCTRKAYVLKADIKQYFETVDRKILLRILQKNISDKMVMWLITLLLANYKTIFPNKGMPLGNLTSQFFANVYLNELDKFVKHQLRAKYYIRYVDDFVIMHHSQELLEAYLVAIGIFLRRNLALHLHPLKTRIIPFERGTDFLGLKIFPHHQLLKKKNLRKFQRKFADFCVAYDGGKISPDTVYDFLESWISYAKNANTYTLRKKILQRFEEQFFKEIFTKEINRSLSRRKKK